MSFLEEPTWFNIDLADPHAFQLDSLDDLFLSSASVAEYAYMSRDVIVDPHYTGEPPSVIYGSSLSTGVHGEELDAVAYQQPWEGTTGLIDIAEDENHRVDADTIGWKNLEALQGHVKDPRTDSYRPPAPCEYCRQHRLQCLIIRTTTANPNPISACSSCVALFRDCSLAEVAKRCPDQFESIYPVIGNLHGISEMETFTGSMTALGAMEDIGNARDVHPRSLSRDRYSKRSSSRMKGKTRPLRHWFFSHVDNPFPSKEEKLHLQKDSGLTTRQIQDWFNNARRKQKVSNEALNPQVYAHGSPMPTHLLADLSPLQRWRNSPPEDDHVPLELLQEAAELPLSEPVWADDQVSNQANRSNDGSSLYSFLASATTSLSSHSESSYAMSDSANSHTSNSSRRSGLVGARTGTERLSANTTATYQCTFCDASFRKKSDWCRHETSIHIHLDSWICQKPTPIIWQVRSLQAQCNYCGIEQPSQEHNDSHEFTTCADRPLADRTFRRKDHLWQHLKKFHGCRSWNGQNLNMERSRRTTLPSRCGFCNVSLHTWDERASHLARHFRQGSQMIQWVGDWGFDAETLLLLERYTLPSDRLR